MLLAAMAVPALAADNPDVHPTQLCASTAPGAPACNVPKQDLKEAKAAFSRGLKLQNGKHLEEALQEFETASRLVPQDIEFATARELTRQQLVYEHMERGNRALLASDQISALGEFRAALDLDPDNEFARQRVSDAADAPRPDINAPSRVLRDTGLIQLAPEAKRADFHFRGDSRALLTRIAQTFGVTPIFDDSVISRRVRVDLEDVDFYSAMQAASGVTKTFWTPIEEKQLLIAADTPENHKQFDRMAARTFYIGGATSAQDLNEVVNALRSLFEIRFMAQQPSSNTITVRAPQRVLEAATPFVESLGSGRPEVLLEVKIYEVSNTLTRNIGMHIPYTFQMFNIPASALAGLGGQNLQQLINQLIASGGINQANNTSISALLAQLQGQQNSIFSQPLATFGNGLTLFGVSLDQLSATLSLNQSSIKSLEHAMLRAGQGKDATFKLGSRYPILNASFAPIFNSSSIAQVIGNNSFQAAFPSFNYEDIGLTIKAKPQIHGNSDVGLELEMQLRSLGTQTLNGVPVINNREFKGAMTLKDGEPAVVAGSVTRSEQRTLNGIPGFGEVPLLNKISATNTLQRDEDELLIVITPHVLTSGGSEAGAEVWLSPAR
jgi:general secretion pathway protein D